MSSEPSFSGKAAPHPNSGWSGKCGAAVGVGVGCFDTHTCTHGLSLPLSAGGPGCFGSGAGQQLDSV